ncbi:hypothetical protein HMPREF1141_1957 [Clostridium sp. MSTE9]|uniref:hypothetical protein n=1 Tax=Clostridium sp. (strain MSTE9) TaxID=1105031 RepID=UPI00026F4168|nr:hypothetical protein [Clostridium sp. MSTE9]EJF39621.1 hypothetical protein HMPREF1141_1957 [Clostridium sp. MSTE9]
MTKKENNMEFNPDLVLTVLAKKMNIPISYVYKELYKQGFFLSTESAKKALQRGMRLGLNIQQCQAILSEAGRNYINDIKYKPTPDRISVSPKRTKNYKIKQTKAAEEIENGLKEDEIKQDEFLDLAYSLSQQPNINNNKITTEEIKHAIDYGKELFVSFLSPQAAYILSQNTDAFKYIIQDMELLDFCDFVMELNEKSKNELREMNITFYGTFHSVVTSLNNQAFKEWLRIYGGNYEKTVKQKMTSYKKEISKKKLDISKFNDEERKDVDYMAEQFFVEDCWEFFQEKMEDDFSKTPENPIAMIILTFILNDVDLLLGFLFCNSEGRELILAKAKELSELEKGTTPQIAN